MKERRKAQGTVTKNEREADGDERLGRVAKHISEREKN